MLACTSCASNATFNCPHVNACAARKQNDMATNALTNTTNTDNACSLIQALFWALQIGVLLGFLLDRFFQNKMAGCAARMWLDAGVVGNTPIIRPYDCFQYYSSAMIESMQGAMHGTFQMLRTHPESQQQFDAQVLPFKLIASKWQTPWLYAVMESLLCIRYLWLH